MVLITFRSTSKTCIGTITFQHLLKSLVLFNWVLFCLTGNKCSYADDTTLHACDSDLKGLIARLEHDILLAIEWFQGNCIKLNEEKCHLLIPGHKHELFWTNIGRSKIWESEKQKLLGIVIDWNLRFWWRKLSVLVIICKFMAVEQRRILMKAFIES